jgi:hypothetical protein
MNVKYNQDHKTPVLGLLELRTFCGEFVRFFHQMLRKLIFVGDLTGHRISEANREYYESF